MILGREQKIGFSEGLYGTNHFKAPEYILRDCMNEKADLMASQWERYSDHQKQKIISEVMKDPDKTLKSGAYEAFLHDRKLQER